VPGLLRISLSGIETAKGWNLSQKSEFQIQLAHSTPHHCHAFHPECSVSANFSIQLKALRSRLKQLDLAPKSLYGLKISDHRQSWEYEDGLWKGPGFALLVIADF
jgi:hypothetical protein